MSKVLVDRELLPCPFCGQQEAFVEQLDSDASVVICQGMVDEHSACLARGPVGVQQSDMEDQPGKDAAIAEWNRRAQPAEAEGPERWSELRALAESAPGKNWKAGNAYGKPFIPTYQVIADTVDGPCVILEGNKNFIEQAEAAATFAAAANPSAVLELLAALSAVTAERDGLVAARTAYASEFAPDKNGDPDVGSVHANIRALKAERDQLRAEVEMLRDNNRKAAISDAAMAAKEA